MSDRIEIKKFTFQDKDLYEAALDIRNKVFVKEQNVSESEELEHEEESVYYLLFYDKTPVATGRYRVTTEGIKLERFATLPAYRGKGLASKLLRYVLDDLKEEEGQIYLHSQEYIMNLYEKAGFEKEGDRFYEAGIPHFKMILKK